MEEKTDKVVGYIEYLGAGGMIGEIVPYTSVEKFKDEILDSLDCGRPVTPVVFSDELDEPLQFDSDTYFPWGFRSEKRVQIPYEIYQTNRRDLVFMEYSPARLAAGAKDYELVYKGQMERWETLDSIYSRHNRDDRPNAKSPHHHHAGLRRGRYRCCRAGCCLRQRGTYSGRQHEHYAGRQEDLPRQHHLHDLQPLQSGEVPAGVRCHHQRHLLSCLSSY